MEPMMSTQDWIDLFWEMMPPEMRAAFDRRSIQLRRCEPALEAHRGWVVL
jgi:hypothetical protein